jgi:heme O synthase-like polyprenyltransferase
LPGFFGVVNFLYVPISVALGGAFVAVAMRFLRTRARGDARLLFISSIVYLPLLFAALVLTKI